LSAQWTEANSVELVGMAQTWFITGSSRGLGRALVEAALHAGDLVAATARQPAQLDDLFAEFQRAAPGLS
jgi:NAD(P)-dependent dehydrogenase (short-subunit alcohol dehydrogenase family)